MAAAKRFDGTIFLQVSNDLQGLDLALRIVLFLPDGKTSVPTKMVQKGAATIYFVERVTRKESSSRKPSLKLVLACAEQQHRSVREFLKGVGNDLQL